MPNRTDRADQTAPPGRRATWISPVWLLVLGVWLGSLLNLALNTATDPTRPYPKPLRWLELYPWQAVGLLTLLAAILAWWQYRRTAITQPQGGVLLPGMLTLHQETVITAAELAGLRRQLLEQVRRTWIQGVLDRSLAQVSRVELGLAEQAGAVDHPWRTLVVQPGHADQPLPPGTRIAEAADRFDGQMLILGGPGAGKTTLLLEYARDLLDQADRDAAAPIPVILHLSAWPAEQPPLAGWLVEELSLRYGVARRLAVELVSRDLLAVLLDGLDEVPQARREACVATINAFRSEHGGVPLVVCARSRDYKELAAHLILKGAVVVQPLDRGQIRNWLKASGSRLAGLRAALSDAEHWLWDLLESPLLLSVAALTYTGQPAGAVRPHGSMERLLEAYVGAMLARPRAPLAAQQDQIVAYTDADTVRWLGWLAKRMRDETVFYPDWMQTDWLPTHRQRWLATTGAGLAAGLIGGLVAGLIVGLGAVLVSGLVAGLVSGMFFGLVGCLVVGRSMGLTRSSSRIEPVEQTRWAWSAARDSLVDGLGTGLICGAVFGLLVWLFLGRLVDKNFELFPSLLGSLLGGLLIGLTVVLTNGFESRPNVRPAAPLEGIRAAAWVGRRSALAGGLTVGLVTMLLIGLGATLIDELRTGLIAGLAVGLTIALIQGLDFGLDFGGASYLRHRLLTTLLQRQRLLPPDLISFLDYADSRILLRRAGGGYLFIHRLLQDYFRNRAHQTEESHNRGWSALGS